jgi:hypothetical protein
VSDISNRLATKAVFADLPAQATGADGRSTTWITRGGNFAICVSRVEPGAVLERADNPEEYMVILPPDGTTATIEAGGETIEAGADSLTAGHPRVPRRARARVRREREPSARDGSLSYSFSS